MRERPTFVEAGVGRGADAVVVQWAHDSAYRFFPLMQHEGSIGGAFPRIVPTR